MAHRGLACNIPVFFYYPSGLLEAQAARHGVHVKWDLMGHHGTVARLGVVVEQSL